MARPSVTIVVPTYREVESLPQSDVDTSKAAADRRRDGAFQGDAAAADRLQDVLRQRRPVLGHHVLAGLLDVPVELDARGLQDPNGGIGDLRADTVARDERYRVTCHAAPSI